MFALPGSDAIGEHRLLVRKRTQTFHQRAEFPRRARGHVWTTRWSSRSPARGDANSIVISYVFIVLDLVHTSPTSNMRCRMCRCSGANCHISKQQTGCRSLRVTFHMIQSLICPYLLVLVQYELLRIGAARSYIQMTSNVFGTHACASYHAACME